jgi:hypothetical protein
LSSVDLEVVGFRIVPGNDRHSLRGFATGALVQLAWAASTWSARKFGVGGLDGSRPDSEPLPHGRDVLVAEAAGGEHAVGDLVQPTSGVGEIPGFQARI